MKEVKKAFALKYPKDSYAPFVIAKEKGVLAQKLIEIAKENNVPIVENEIASEVLTFTEIGECIPEEIWEVMAKIFAFIRKNEEKFVENNLEL